jgi:hypothetical protein
MTRFLRPSWCWVPRPVAWCVIAACLSSAPSSLAQGASASPRLASWSIDQEILESSDLNFRLNAPPGWTWSEDKGARNPSANQYSFVVRTDPRTFFRLLVRSKNLYENSPRSVREFLDGVAAGQASLASS